MDEKLSFETGTHGDWKMLIPKGRIDTTTAGEAEQVGMKELEGAGKLAMDLTQLDYLSSAGLRVLLKMAKKSRAAGGEFALCGAKGVVREVLEESGMDTIINTVDDVRDLD